MENAKITNLYNLDETIAKEYLSQFTYPWEALAGISDFIKEIGPTLDPEIYEKRGEDIWVAKSATVFDSAYLHGPLIICEDAEIRQCAFIRGSAIVGKGSVVGNSTELKKCNHLQLSTGATLQLCRRFNPGLQITYGRRLYYIKCKE